MMLSGTSSACWQITKYLSIITLYTLSKNLYIVHLLYLPLIDTTLLLLVAIKIAAWIIDWGCTNTYMYHIMNVTFIFCSKVILFLYFKRRWKWKKRINNRDFACLHHAQNNRRRYFWVGTFRTVVLLISSTLLLGWHVYIWWCTILGGRGIDW